MMRLPYLCATTFAVLLGLIPSLSHAQDFLDGWYSDPQESGWGINVEVQGDIMFLAVFSYRTNGKPVWYTGVDQNFSYDTRVFEADLELFDNGACFTCAYFAPDPGVLGDGGHIRIEFNSLGNVVVTWKGRTATLKRLYWAYGSKNDFLFGIWAVVRGIDVLFANYYLLNDRFTNEGLAFIGGASNRDALVVAFFDPELDAYVMLERVELSTGTMSDWLYVFAMTKSQMVGRYYILEPGESPVGDGTEFVAYRLGQQEIQTKRHANLEALTRLEMQTYRATGKAINMQAAELYRQALLSLQVAKWKNMRAR